MLLESLGNLISFKDFSSKYLRSQIQYLFLSMLVLLIPWTLKFLTTFTEIVQSLKQGNPNYPWPSYSDFLKSLFFSLFLLGSSTLFRKFLTSTGDKLISSKYKGEDRSFRAEKLVDCTFKGIYYLFSSTLGYFIAKDCDFLTSRLGGHGSSVNSFKGYPYQSYSNYEEIKFYLVMQLGYHLFSLFQHILKKPKNDYIEMLLHHLMTVALIGLAYFMNYVAISVIVLMVHDFSDVFGYIVRVFVDTNFKVVTLAAYFGLLISWLYLRLVVFPFDIIYYGLYLNLEIFDLPGTILLAVMLHCLVVLHLYWYYLFIQMGLKFLKTKTTQDTYHVE